VLIHPVGLERRVVAGLVERPRGDAQPRIAAAVFLVQRTSLVEETQIGALHVEAHRGDLAAMPGEMLEDRREQELDGAGLGGEP